MRCERASHWKIKLKARSLGTLVSPKSRLFPYMMRFGFPFTRPLWGYFKTNTRRFAPDRCQRHAKLNESHERWLQTASLQEELVHIISANCDPNAWHGLSCVGHGVGRDQSPAVSHVRIGLSISDRTATCCERSHQESGSTNRSPGSTCVCSEARQGTGIRLTMETESFGLGPKNPRFGVPKCQRSARTCRKQSLAAGRFRCERAKYVSGSRDIERWRIFRQHQATFDLLKSHVRLGICCPLPARTQGKQTGGLQMCTRHIWAHQRKVCVIV